VGLDPPLAWRSGAPDSYGSATLVGQVDGNGQVIGNGFAAVGSVALDIRARRPVSDLVTRRRGHGNLFTLLPPGPLPWGSGNCLITLRSCPTR
jgi:hypothetical protein